MLAVLALCVALAVAAPAGSVGTITKTFEQAQNSGADVWTASQYANAKSMPFPAFSANSAAAAFADQALAGTGSGSAAGATPSKFKLDLTQLHAPVETALSDADDQVEPNGAGTSLKYYTSSRLIPLTADLTYPHITVGRLFFTVSAASGLPAGSYSCSASVLRKRIVLTAGHCVHSGKNGASGWFSNFRFVPSYRDGGAPFGTWTFRSATTTTTWTTGGGTVPNAADYAMLIAIDQSGVRIGDRVGYLGYSYGSGVTTPNHVTMFGYPSNIDSSSKMHRVDSGPGNTYTNNCIQYGSDMGKGSSGGPWIQNFGAPGVNQPVPNYKPTTNAVIAVTSFGSTSPDPKYQGASIFDSRFQSVLNVVCATASNCA